MDNMLFALFFLLLPFVMCFFMLRHEKAKQRVLKLRRRARQTWLRRREWEPFDTLNAKLFEAYERRESL